MKARNNQADDRLLVEAAQQDPARFADLYERHFDFIYAFVVRKTHDRDAAQDVTSEVFHSALANLGRFEWRGVPFSAWLMRIAINALADHFGRTARNRKISGLDEAKFEPQVSESLETINVLDPYARIFRSVKILPEDQRRVVEMRFAEEKSIREIAREMGRSEGAIKQLQFRALESLRAELDIKRVGKQLSRLQQKSGGRNG